MYVYVFKYMKVKKEIEKDFQKSILLYIVRVEIIFFLKF